MNFEKIEQLIKLVKDNDMKKFKYKDYEQEIEFDFTDNQINQSVGNAATQQQGSDSQQITNQQQTASDESVDYVKAPMVGTFFLQDEKELTNPLVNVGDEIKKGDTIGYIEAMKVLNEVTSDVEGVVDEILVSHGTNVEYDQAIIKVK
ncbi:biotin/lipoyl-containing protein [Staphylococcus gallinarum]|uniref:acetyl-CoA carboxylase biotin carboxyl carrier protein n=1 Tax=Staphylococcus gallinarum TaxID=1293 RepID=UPI000D1C6E6B|nr:biotin/lipoyl-containing protein [Staphylococcus gallinarum]MBU7216802.1 acetyl-CoA carboxylase biotin carboxyl carrier protein subunit [Staphylococcus gallinarum]MCD8793727.1 acetyl-CoA carboxylase biotin carboxyl carrier protein subunit [Staphylococcus gallinarum]MDN6412846.1 biotin/lipoyl-containing protein [Staphylococcus gallinarum]PTE32799.1 acetyl-CoA carboxylase biotin carboxyl carrier protein subunit [Staphylococcus gallinarum]PTK91558.1 acetyl-CoA carboxylase biotin carboxyl carri